MNQTTVEIKMRKSEVSFTSTFIGEGGRERGREGGREGGRDTVICTSMLLQPGVIIDQ
jgi:hypothetical protein